MTSERNQNDASMRLQDLLRLIHRINMSEANMVSALIEIALECDITDLTSSMSEDLKIQLYNWLPQSPDELIFVPRVSSEKDKALREAMRMLKQICRPSNQYFLGNDTV